MPIISTIGRRSFKVRILLGGIYISLIIGAFSMVYPFMLMIAGTTKSGVDAPESELIPSFLKSDLELYRKSMEGYFNESMNVMQMAFSNKIISFRKCKPPKSVNDKLVDSWGDFQKEADLPFYYYGLAFLQTPISRNSLPFMLRKFKNQLYREYKGSIEEMNRDLGSEYVAWNSFIVFPEKYLMRRFLPSENRIHEKYRAFKEKQPNAYRYYFCPEGYYKTSFLMPIYTKNLESYNEAHKSNYKSWNDIHLTRTYPSGEKYTDKEREDWEEYVRSIVNLLWIRGDKKAEPLYQNFLKAKYDTITSLNKRYRTTYKSFSNIPIIDQPPFSGLALSDWNGFIQGWKDPETGKNYMVPIEMLKIHSVEFLYRDYLKNKFGTIEKVNAALGTGYDNWLSIFPPQYEYNFRWFLKNSGDLKWEFIKRNYIAVVDYIVLHGRGILNTTIYCLLSILFALLVNPIAAYALSRYKLASSYKILLFLMLTMAFPPMVTQIPVFLMLREFKLLNSFAALLLPAMANGYSIFLLKGFFDSLPHELYEVAEIDGASEFYIFMKITMSLSKPILAVIALQAFTHAYANFMMALLICQDEKMWTLMPWLYQLQQRSCQGVVFSSLIIAAIPTFIIFGLCQNVIMRGIVVPVEK